MRGNLDERAASHVSHAARSQLWVLFANDSTYVRDTEFWGYSVAMALQLLIIAATDGAGNGLFTVNDSTRLLIAVRAGGNSLPAERRVRIIKA